MHNDGLTWYRKNYWLALDEAKILNAQRWLHHRGIKRQKTKIKRIQEILFIFQGFESMVIISLEL